MYTNKIITENEYNNIKNNVYKSEYIGKIYNLNTAIKLDFADKFLKIGLGFFITSLIIETITMPIMMPISFNIWLSTVDYHNNGLLYQWVAMRKFTIFLMVFNPIIAVANISIFITGLRYILKSRKFKEKFSFQNFIKNNNNYKAYFSINRENYILKFQYKI